MTKNCETLPNQTHRKAEETLEFKMAKPRRTFHSNRADEVTEDSMIGLTSLEVYISLFSITKGNNNFKLHKYPDGKNVSVSYEEVRDEIQKDLEITDITATDLEDDMLAPNIIEE